MSGQGSGFDNFIAIESLMSGGTSSKNPNPVVDSPTRMLQLELLKHVIGDSYKKTKVKLITTYDTAGEEGITELEDIINDPSAELLNKELHWGTTTTKTDDGIVTAPCLSILVTYKISNYGLMLDRLEKHAEQQYMDKDYLNASDRSMAELIIGGIIHIKFWVTDPVLSLRATRLIDKLKAVIARKADAEPLPDPDKQTKVQQGKSKKSKKSKKSAAVEQEMDDSRVPLRVFQDIDGVPVIKLQSTVFDMVEAAEKEAPEKVPAENVAKNKKKD